MQLEIFAAVVFIANVQCSTFRGTYITWVVNQTDLQYYPGNVLASSVKVCSVMYACQCEDFIVPASVFQGRHFSYNSLS